MSLPSSGWKNKNGTAERSCKCGSWKEHWEKNSSSPWPTICSAYDCNNRAEVGAHVINSACRGEWIVPLCKACNNKSDEFSLKASTALIVSNLVRNFIPEKSHKSIMLR